MSRSQQMARIKGRHTKPEQRLRSTLWAAGLRYRTYSSYLLGHPEIVFPGQRVAVFVDGCFWHGCPLHYVRPRTQHEFWADKLAANVARDRRQTLALEQDGWQVLRFWEHEIQDRLEAVHLEIEAAVRTGARLERRDWRVWRVDPLGLGNDHERRYLVDLRDPSLSRTEDGPRFSRSGPRAAAPAGTANRTPPTGRAH